VREDLVSRRVRWPQDAAVLDRLVGDAWLASRPRASLHPADVVWRACLRDPDELRLFSTGAGEAVGLVELDSKDSSCDIAVRPGHGEILERELFTWAEEEGRRRGDGDTFTVGCFDGNDGRARLLETLGYEPSDDFYPHFLRPLDDIPEPEVPESYVVRPLRDADLAARVELGRLAFGRTALTVGKLRAARAGPGYDPELDLLAVDDRGEPAAFALCWAHRRTGLGQFEPLGCHPDHRRRGLARAVIAEGLRRLRDRGALEALVETGSDNAGACALYEACGFQVVGEDRDWIKPF
jgi:ribosomal protein S18 acetylase RimI-like enzyme